MLYYDDDCLKCPVIIKIILIIAIITPKMIIILGMCRRSAQRWTSAAHVKCGALRASLLLSAVDKIVTIYS